MRVALLLYGHSRTLSNTHKSVINNIINQNGSFQFDVFLSTWDRQNVNGPADNKIVIEELCNLYSPKAFRIHSETSMAYRKFSDQFKEYPISTINTFYHFTCLHSLVEKSEKSGRFQYDWVLITRPDIEFFSPLRLEALEAQYIRGNVYVEDLSTTYVPYVLSDHLGQLQDLATYAPAIDLLSINQRHCLNTLANFPLIISNFRHLPPSIEFIMSHALNLQDGNISHLGYEKDKHFCIRREKKLPIISRLCKPISYLLNLIFLISAPLIMTAPKARRMMLFNPHLVSIRKLRALKGFFDV